MLQLLLLVDNIEMGEPLSVHLGNATTITEPHSVQLGNATTIPLVDNVQSTDVLCV